MGFIGVILIIAAISAIYLTLGMGGDFWGLLSYYIIAIILASSLIYFDVTAERSEVLKDSYVTNKIATPDYEITTYEPMLVEIYQVRSNKLQFLFFNPKDRMYIYGVKSE